MREPFCGLGSQGTVSISVQAMDSMVGIDWVGMLCPEPCLTAGSTLWGGPEAQNWGSREGGVSTLAQCSWKGEIGLILQTRAHG